MKPRTIRLKQGLDLPVGGKPELTVEASPVTRIAFVGLDHHGLKPRMQVKAGDAVKRGTPLVEDRAREGVLHTSPGAGTIVAIHRGERRRLLSVEIQLTDNEASGTLDKNEQ